jgi:hypothetical protein
MDINAAIIDENTNIVTNTIVLGGVWQAPQGFYLVVSQDAGIGDYFDKATAQFVKPEQPTEKETDNEM